jgi:hypothetical protein
MGIGFDDEGHGLGWLAGQRLWPGWRDEAADGLAWKIRWAGQNIIAFWDAGN